MKAIWLVLAVALAAASAASAGTLADVQARGFLRCGINPGLAGFGQPDQAGEFQGLNADFCRAIASAIFDDPKKVRFVPLTAKDRLTALQTGEIDVLSHNTTWTMARSAQVEFVAILFYDGQGFMTKKRSGIAAAKDLGGASICTQQGSTTELNLADYFHSHGLTYEAVSFASNEEALNAYKAGRCDAFSTDVTSLYAERVKLPDPEGSIVLPDVIAKEPLGPAVRHGDDGWADIVRWTAFAWLDAEELGITQANVDAMRKSPNPEIRRMLGDGAALGPLFGLSGDWAYRIIKHAGNYGEVFERNLGAGSPMKIKRGLNALWTGGGLQYAPPIR